MTRKIREPKEVRPKKVQLVHYILSHPGKRKVNEDSVFPEHVNGEGARSFLVCDGVGGGKYGEIASAIVSREIGTWLSSHSATENDIRLAIERAESKLAEHSSEFPDCRGMASTLVGFHPSENNHSGYVYWVGDSRLYHIRNGEILFKTKDHSLVQMLVDKGELNEDEMSHNRSKNIILQALNDSELKARPDIAELKDLRERDVILLLSDGILEGCPESHILQLIEEHPLKSAVTQIRRKCEKESSDNFSLIAIEVGRV